MVKYSYKVLRGIHYDIMKKVIYKDITSHLKHKLIVFSWWTKGNICNRFLVSSTHIIMESFCFAGVVTCLSPLWCSTIQVPENTVDKRAHEAKKPQLTHKWTFYYITKRWHLPPPWMQESRGFTKCYVFLPSDLGQHNINNYLWVSATL